MEDHQFNPHQPQEKKKDLFVQYGGIYMGVYILVSTQKVKRRDFDFYNILIFWRVAILKFKNILKILKISNFLKRHLFAFFNYWGYQNELGHGTERF